MGQNIQKNFYFLNLLDFTMTFLKSDGLLCLLDVDKMELIKTKQSQLNKVADFSLNPKPSSHTKGLLDYELLLAGEKKKSVALMHITPDNRFVRVVDEFPLQDVPQSGI